MPGIPIFMYHHISESSVSSRRNMQVSTDEFEHQMRFLFQRGFRCLSLSDFVSRCEQGLPQPKQSFVLTFDDGYNDFYLNASPILRKFEYTATIFVVAGFTEEGKKRHLSWQEMRELGKDHFTFGSHTLTHRSLTALDDSAIKDELVESKELIEDRLGLPVDMLAYPYGDSDERVQDIARQSGYRSACGVSVGHLTPFNLWRVSINEHESEPSFNLKAHGGYYIYNWLKEETPLGKVGRRIRVFLHSSQGKTS